MVYQACQASQGVVDKSRQPNPQRFQTHCHPHCTTADPAVPHPSIVRGTASDDSYLFVEHLRCRLTPIPLPR